MIVLKKWVHTLRELKVERPEEACVLTGVCAQVLFEGGCKMLCLRIVSLSLFLGLCFWGSRKLRRLKAWFEETFELEKAILKGIFLMGCA